MLDWDRDAQKLDLLHDGRVQWVTFSWAELDWRVSEQVIALEVKLCLGQAHELLVSESALYLGLARGTCRLVEGRLVLIAWVLLLYQLLSLRRKLLHKLLLLLHLLETLVRQLAQLGISVHPLMLWRLLYGSHYLLAVVFGRVAVAFWGVARARQLLVQSRQIWLRKVQVMLFGRRRRRNLARFLDGWNGKGKLSVLESLETPLQIPRLLLGNDLRPLPLNLLPFVLLLHALELQLAEPPLFLLLSFLFLSFDFESLLLSSSLLFLAPPLFFFLKSPFLFFSLSLFFESPLPFHF